MDKLYFKYIFEIPDQETIEYHVDIDPNTMSLILDHDPVDPPIWTQLPYKQCDSCTLKNSEHCPVALNLYELLDRFKTVKSYVECKITVDSPQRKFYKEADIQTGLGSLFGLLIATSGCPVMNFFKPMAMFHLPFATTEETIFRSFGSFFIRGFINGTFSKSELLIKLKSDYDKVRNVNLQLIKRFSDLTKDMKSGQEGDANVNAIVILDNFASTIELELDDDLEILTQIFDQKEY